MRFDFPRLKGIDSRCVDAVPLANCILLLLVFMVLTWGNSAQTQAGIKVSLPKAVTSEAVGKGAPVISVTREKLLYLNGEPVSSEELYGRLKGRPAGQAVLIKADKGVALERVVEVWDICKRSGVQQVNIATTQSR